MNNKLYKVLVKGWNRIRENTWGVFSLCFLIFFVFDTFPCGYVFCWKCWRGWIWAFFHVFVCVCFYSVCMLYMFGNMIFLSFFFFNCSCKCYINIAAYSVIRHQDCVSINQFPNDDTLEIEGLCLTPTICECMFTVRCVCVCVPCWVFGLVQPQAVCAHPVPSSLVQAAKALVPWTASSCHMAAPSGTRTGQDFLPHGCF